MGKIIAVANQKGGVGKTTTTINLGAYLAQLDKKVLIIDFDPQGNASSGVGIITNDLNKTIYQVLVEQETYDNCIVGTSIENLFILPANMELAGLDIDLLGHNEKEYMLKKYIKYMVGDYDFLLIDCPPSLGILTLNALAASNSLLIPLQCEYFALEGLSQLLKIIKLVQTKINPSLSVEGVLLTMYDARTNLSFQVVQDVKNHFKKNVFEAIIPRNVKLSEAPSFGKSIHEYASQSSGATSYHKLAKEIIYNQV